MVLSEGLSHIIFNAITAEDFKRALEFYQAVGFKVISDKKENELRTAWLTNETTIKLILNPSSIAQPKIATDIDWSLEENALVFSVEDINVSVKNYKKKKKRN